MTRVKVLTSAGAVALATVAVTLPAAAAHTTRPNTALHKTTVAKCASTQLKQVGKPYGNSNDMTVDADNWLVTIEYRNSGRACNVILPRRATLKNTAGKSVTTKLYQPQAPYLMERGARVIVTLELNWSPPQGHYRGCKATLRNITSATIKLDGAKVTFPVKPAFTGACKGNGTSVYAGPLPL